MSEFKFGDRVEYIGDECQNTIKVGDKGTIVSVGDNFVGVDFDRNIYGHDCKGCGRDEHCWYVSFKYLKKIEETKEESKTETMEQKILTVLREEIGVEIGEKFDVYENGEKQWTCKFDEVGFPHEIDDEFRESGFWKQIICKFHSYQFKKKPFAPKYEEEYVSLLVRYDENGNIFFIKVRRTWTGDITDYGMLALGNVFRTEEEALKSRNEMLERLEKLRNGE